MSDPSLHIAVRIVLALSRHAIAALLTVSIPCVLFTIAYLAILFEAMRRGGGLGSPATYPLGLIFIVAVAGGIALVFFSVPTALAELLTRRLGQAAAWQLPISAGISSLFAIPAAALLTFSAGGGIADFPIVMGLMILAHAAPLAFYWTVLRSGPFLVWLALRFPLLLAHAAHGKPGGRFLGT